MCAHRLWPDVFPMTSIILHLRGAQSMGLNVSEHSSLILRSRGHDRAVSCRRGVKARCVVRPVRRTRLASGSQSKGHGIRNANVKLLFSLRRGLLGMSADLSTWKAVEMSEIPFSAQAEPSALCGLLPPWSHVSVPRMFARSVRSYQSGRFCPRSFPRNF